ncbi:MAG: integrase core domain-containing protein [Firmicutes bacterium]|nr:integrase core domain-containing protein [Bacillota bacterium]
MVVQKNAKIVHVQLPLDKKLKLMEKIAEQISLGVCTKTKAIKKIARSHMVSESSLFGWYETWEQGGSLARKPRVDAKSHWQAQTKYETDNIVRVVSQNHSLGYDEYWSVLHEEIYYNRTYSCLRTTILKLFPERKHVKNKRINKKYHTPKMFGIKWQFDVKSVPRECIIQLCQEQGIELQDLPIRKKYYQYSMIDEADRVAFVYIYVHHGAEESVDFISRAIKFYGYTPDCIQTDNGKEFTNRFAKNAVQRNIDTLINGLLVKEVDIEYEDETTNKDGRYYKYLLIDNNTNKQFETVYESKGQASTAEFIPIALNAFGLTVEEMQQNGGVEFANRFTLVCTLEHIVDAKLRELGIRHKLILPGTPRHNGKVERFHRKCQERFYNTHKFRDLDDINEQIAQWLILYNNTPNRSLVGLDGKCGKTSPNDAHMILLQALRRQEQSKDNAVQMFGEFVTLQTPKWTQVA